MTHPWWLTVGLRGWVSAIARASSFGKMSTESGQAQFVRRQRKIDASLLTELHLVADAERSCSPRTAPAHRAR